ncbi:uncharacterized protein [Apostichopus japonicus]|uniref:uncharacterized protein n=1 Tax=Stichopus japonicus TaxID=307972 RepID=UPI003AB7CE7F
MSAKGISFEATTSSDMEAADVGHAEMDEIPVCTLESATDNATGATVGKSSSERSETGDLSEVGNAGGILTSNKVDYDESEVVQTHLDVLNEKVLKDLFCDVCLPENKHEALLKPQQRGIEIRLEEYYAVFYDNEFYIGRLLEKDGEEYLFKFLHRVRSASKMYDWPIRSDSEKVLGKFVIDGPLTLVGSGPFSVQEIENVEKAYAEMKAITQAEL